MIAGKKVLMRQKYLIVVMMMLSLIFAGCLKNKELSENTDNSADSQTRIQSTERTAFLVKDQKTVVVYFATPDQKNLVPVTLAIKPTKEAAKVALEKLLAGPENDFSNKTIPEGTKLIDLYLQGRTVYADLTKELSQVPEERAQQAIDALVLTLTEFAEVDDVQILMNRQVEEKLGPVDISKPIQRPALINYYDKPGKATAKAFFSDSNAVYLVPVTLNVDTDNIPLSILKKLIAGPPEKSGLLPTVWQGTRIKDFTIKDGVATVDFSPEVLGYGGGTTAEMMLVNSVVLTLTQFEDIDAVQFLIDGKQLEYLPEGRDISSPIPKPAKINFIE